MPLQTTAASLAVTDHINLSDTVLRTTAIFYYGQVKVLNILQR